jgi:hypothetical protein
MQKNNEAFELKLTVRRLERENSDLLSMLNGRMHFAAVVDIVSVGVVAFIFGHLVAYL